MKRRVLLSAAVGMTLAGCTSDDTNDDENEAPKRTDSSETTDLESVALEAEDFEDADAKYELRVRYASTVQQSVSPESMENGGHESSDGEKYLVVRMAVENVGDTEYTLASALFTFERGDELYPFNIPLGEDQVGSTLAAGESDGGWLVTSIPSDVTEGTLKVREYEQANYSRSVSVEFERDDSMAVDMEAL